jgi:hypothetical protein
VASWTGDLTVRPVSCAETARFGELLAAHHWLGARLFGSVVRHVAVLDGAWVALLGYGSAVLRCTARDTVIGWSDPDRLDRLPMLAGQQRFCVLPQGRQPNLASAVLARSLARLPGDYLELHNQIMLAVEGAGQRVGAAMARKSAASSQMPKGIKSESLSSRLGNWGSPRRSPLDHSIGVDRCSGCARGEATAVAVKAAERFRPSSGSPRPSMRYFTPTGIEVPRTEMRVRVSQAAAASGESGALAWRAAT